MSINTFRSAKKAGNVARTGSRNRQNWKLQLLNLLVTTVQKPNQLGTYKQRPPSQKLNLQHRAPKSHTLERKSKLNTLKPETLNRFDFEVPLPVNMPG